MFEQRSNIFPFFRFVAATCLAVLAGCAGRGNVTDLGSTVAAPASPASLNSVPMGIAAIAGNAKVSLKWSTSSSASSYHVKRATASGGPYTQIGTPTSTTYTDSAVVNGTKYYYVVSALDSAGESANSAQVSAVPGASAAAPAIPTVPAGLSAAKGSGQVTLSWSASIGATSYHVKRGAASGGPYTQVGAPTATTYTDSALTNGTTYYYVVSALDSAGESANSAPLSAVPSAPAVQGTPPALVPGVWTNITPPAPGFSSTYGTAFIEVSPVDPNVIYAQVDTQGLWKTTDRGSTWTKLGVPGTYQAGSLTTSYIDEPITVKVDPGDANHIIATDGVRGATLGFWESHDGGNTWTMPQGFVNIAKTATNDVTQMAVDPTNFKHILLSSHSPWANMSNAGIMESTDGGQTWVLHAPDPSWSVGSLGINFLYDPASGQGNSNTWIVATDGAGFWRTTNAGASWVKVADFNVTHGGAQLYYAKDGSVYSGAAQYPVRSHDNGVTWEAIQNGLSYFYYYTVYGDGDTLYTQLANTGTNAGQGLQPYMTAPEATGGPWTPYQGGAQKFNDGPFMMHYDAVNQIMYSANWASGVWALKVIKP
jgi:hypothetical protein